MSLCVRYSVKCLGVRDCLTTRVQTDEMMGQFDWERAILCCVESATPPVIKHG